MCVCHGSTWLVSSLLISAAESQEHHRVSSWWATSAPVQQSLTNMTHCRKTLSCTINTMWMSSSYLTLKLYFLMSWAQCEGGTTDIRQVAFTDSSSRSFPGKNHVCKFIGCGRNDKFNYVVMQLQVSDGLEAFIVKGTTAQGWRDTAALQQRLIAVVVVDSRSGRGFNTVSLSV